MSKHFGDSAKEKLPFNRKKPPAEPGSGRGGHLLRPVGVKEGKQDERHAVEERQRLITDMIQCREVY